MAVQQIDGARQIKSATITNAQIAAGAAIALSKLAVSVVAANGSVAFTADQSMGGNKLTNVATPVSATDAANKGYVDGLAQGVDWKTSVRAATTAAGTLASSFANGSVIDGVTLATGDRILIQNQSTGSENGIYTVNATGAPTRATDADTSAKVTPNMSVFVEEGTTNADSAFTLTNNGSITLGTTALVFTQFTSLGQIQAGNGLTKTGNSIDVVGTANRIVVAADSIDIGTDVVTLTGTQTLTNKSISGSQITSAVANATTAVNFSGNLAGDVTGAQGATVVGKINGVALSGLGTGILKNTTSTGVPSIAVAGDFPTLNQNTTGTAANVTGTVAIANGGTGATSKSAGFDALSPLTTAGDLIIGGASGTGTRLATGATAGQVLTSNGSGNAPSWQAPAAGTIFVTRETPTGTIDGTNTTFTLANTPTSGSEEVYLNGILQDPGAGNDYTISGATITYLSAPLSGDKIRVNYRR